MKLKIYKISLIITFGLFFSCATVNDITGKYGPYSTNFILMPSGTFKYEVHSEFYWRWSYGKWEKVKGKKYRLVSTRHDSIPLHVTEEKNDAEQKTIILSNASRWDTNFFIKVNDKSYKLPENDLSLILANSEIETISITSFIGDKNYYWHASHPLAQTVVYHVKDKTNNVFYIHLPDNNSLDDYYYLQEFDWIISIRKNALIQDGYKYKRVRD